MASVTLQVAPADEVKGRVAKAFKGQPQPPTITFASVDLLWQVLTRKRWEILRLMTGQGPLSIREVARRAGRDVKAVHADVHALLLAGLLDRTEAGRIEFPFDGIHVDFELKAA